MFFLENQQLKVSVHPKGAELQGLWSKKHQLEYMWSGDPAVWGKHSPMLFPIVGTLKGNTYYYQDKSYSLSRHGFARDREFEVESHQADTITFLLRSDDATRAVYPFDFELRVIYRILQEGLSVTYEVMNPAKETLYFSVGGHPAFKVPLVPDTDYQDYYLSFDRKETAPRWPISGDGLIENQPQALLQDTDTLPLTKDLFAKDALVFKHLASSGVTLRCAKTARGLRMDFPGFPFLGIWAAPKADFVCIEPWCGIADSVNSDQQYAQKEGINQLEAGGVFERMWALTLL
jgi:galactose mutarotase-like enzyme